MRLLGMALGTLVLTAATAWPQSTPICTTHFNNQSNFQWSIYNFDGRKSALYIPPHTTVPINWGTTSTVSVTGNIPNHLYMQRFQVQLADSCVALKAQGSAGLVSINKPGNGDITTCAGGC